jgi:hypothetical protein
LVQKTKKQEQTIYCDKQSGKCHPFIVHYRLMHHPNTFYKIVAKLDLSSEEEAQLPPVHSFDLIVQQENPVYIRKVLALYFLLFLLSLVGAIYFSQKVREVPQVELG